jgi:hypothetical protein
MKTSYTNGGGYRFFEQSRMLFFASGGGFIPAQQDPDIPVQRVRSLEEQNRMVPVVRSFTSAFKQASTPARHLFPMSNQEELVRLQSLTRECFGPRGVRGTVIRLHDSHR